MSWMEGNETDLRRSNASPQFGRRDMFFYLLCSLSVFWAVVYFAGLGRGRAAGLCAGVALKGKSMVLVCNIGESDSSGNSDNSCAFWR
jgi:hypothetical protein